MPETLVDLPIADGRGARRVTARRLRTMWFWAPGWSRQACCGRIPTGGQVAVVRSPSGSAYVAGVQRCGSIWCCPTCTPWIRWRREQVLRQAMDAHVAMGGSLRLLTLTVPHTPSDQLDRLFDGVAAVWRWSVSGRIWMGAQRGLGISAWVRSMEVTAGAGGWHPHLHVALLLDGPADDETVRVWWHRRWVAACERFGLHRPSAARGVTVRDIAGSTAGYVVRVATEVARADVKTGRDKARFAVLQLFDLASTDRARWARDAWLDLAAATRGRHATYTSAGLRRLIPRVQPADLPQCPPSELVVIDAEQWRALRHQPTALTNALVLYEQGHDAQAAALLHAFGADISSIAPQ
ncbi:hypothetical protein ACFFRE_00190 [Aciditerrimonas ferrireducens]|uniref:Replication protein n=1 Tax=Aciditerrimonas ferrireducens TaxID=667306 RepID=A0ABV6C2T3_9ACTN